MKLADRIYQLPTQEQQDEAADKVRCVGDGLWGWIGGLCVGADSGGCVYTGAFFCVWIVWGDCTSMEAMGGRCVRRACRSPASLNNINPHDASNGALPKLIPRQPTSTHAMHMQATKVWNRLLKVLNAAEVGR